MKKIIVLGVGIVLLAALVVLALRMFTGSTSTPGTQTSGTVQQPFPSEGGSNTPSAVGGGIEVGGTGKPTLTVASQNPTGTMTVQDFRSNSDTTQDPVNTSFYYLKYHTVGSNATQDPPYTISYDSMTGAFTVALYHEPIKETRADAEQYLMGVLGLSKSGMCSLRYIVSVPDDVNSYYAGTNLLFSFCPGATVLP